MSAPVTGLSHDELQQAARDHLWLHFTRMSGYREADVPIIVRGDGCRHLGLTQPFESAGGADAMLQGQQAAGVDYRLDSVVLHVKGIRVRTAMRQRYSAQEIERRAHLQRRECDVAE